MTPCRSDCPAGACAGCAFPPRCEPSRPCPQHDVCSRPRELDARIVIDGTIVWLAPRNGGWCPLFVDARAAALGALPCS